MPRNAEWSQLRECRMHNERQNSCTENIKRIISVSHRKLTHLNVGIEGSHSVTITTVLVSLHKQHSVLQAWSIAPYFS